MKHYAGLDVSVEETSVCILDETGKICREVKVTSHPEDLLRILQDPTWHLDRIGLEAGQLSQWLFDGLADAGLPVVCIETRHAKAFLKAQINKSDRHDARGIAQMMRVHLFRPVHVKTLTSQKRRVLLTARKLLQEKAIAIENDIRGLLLTFGLKVGVVGAVKFEERIHALVEGMPDLAEILERLLDARRRLREHFAVLHRKLLDLARGDAVCRRLMTIPGVGPVVSLAFVATIDTPARFRKSKAVGPVLGLTPIRSQSGNTDRVGRISLWGWDDADAAVRSRSNDVATDHPVVVAESLGHEGGPAAWGPKGRDRAGPATGGDHASYVVRWHGVPVDEGRSSGLIDWPIERIQNKENHELPHLGGGLPLAGR